MSFTLRLTADLNFALLSRALTNGHRFPPILEVSADGHFKSTRDSLVSNESGNEVDLLRTLAHASRYRSPIIWVGGPEPLKYPGVARFANSLAASGRHVFLETSGASLKPRLHEFKPSSRLYLAVRLNTRGVASDEASDPQALLRVGLEAVRMARLAGFYTCVRLIAGPETPVSELESMHCQLRKLDVDGILITPSVVVMTPEFEQQLRQWRRRFLNRRCSLISSLLEINGLPASSQSSPEIGRPLLPDSQQDRLGESAEAG